MKKATMHYEQPRRLPIVTIDGIHYFVDERLREWRRVDNPHERIPFEK